MVNRFSKLIYKKTPTLLYYKKHVIAAIIKNKKNLKKKFLTFLTFYKSIAERFYNRNF